MTEHKKVEQRRRIATEKARRALRALEPIGVKAWIVGSLTSGRFGLYSDVDFLIDCDRELEYQAFIAIEQAMGDFPFHLLPLRRLKEEALSNLMDGAVDALRFLSDHPSEVKG